ncbi:MAG: rsmA [Deltaproteobacteria bacterium]|jgi:16S rRNA (adenine1518-N6/adenine1519-N6)-dimethyltransferase|nr:rsmA [Deltaproteobacteria bacterium]
MPPPGSPADNPRRTLAALGLAPRKRLGQNFLHDGNVVRKIVALARAYPPPFLEIGPGLGALTGPLAESGVPVLAVEVDRGLSAHLAEQFAGTSVEILEADFLGISGPEWLRRFPRGGTVVGNLPYSISSPVVLRLIELRGLFPRAVLMLQREMAERLLASPGGKEYGILSVYLSVLAEARREFAVARGCFHPAPEVDSAVVTVRFFGSFPDPLVESLRVVVRAAFAHRRKTLRNAPVPFLPGGAGEWCGLLEAAGIDPSRRAETVPPASYLGLARRFARM